MSNDFFELTTVSDRTTIRNEDTYIESFTFKNNPTPVVYFRGVATENNFSRLISNHSSVNNQLRCEKDFLLTGFKNCIKMLNALQLNQQLAEGLIDDNEYQRIVEEDEEKYFICIDKKISVGEFEILSALVKEIGNDFTVEDISEFFSVDFSDFEHKLLAIKEK